MNRLVPVLTLHRGGLWKTRRYEPAIYVGDPTNAVRIFNDKGVDELVVLDVDASRQHRAPDWDAVARLAAECFIPLTYGGGIATVADAGRLFELGVEKVVLNHALDSDPALVSAIAAVAGTQAVVAGLDVFRSRQGVTRFGHVARAPVAGDWLAEAQRRVAAGAGELLITVVDRDGSGTGPDLEIARAAVTAGPVPVTLAGGLRSEQDAAALFDVGISAAAGSSMFTLCGPHQAVLITYPPVDLPDVELDL